MPFTFLAVSLLYLAAASQPNCRHRRRRSLPMSVTQVGAAPLAISLSVRPSIRRRAKLSPSKAPFVAAKQRNGKKREEENTRSKKNSLQLQDEQIRPLPNMPNRNWSKFMNGLSVSLAVLFAELETERLLSVLFCVLENAEAGK